MLADLLKPVRPASLTLGRRQRRGALEAKVAIVTGGDSPLARAIALCLAHDGADVVLAYQHEHGMARETVRRIQAQGSRAMALYGELDDPDFSLQVADATLLQLGHTELPSGAPDHGGATAGGRPRPAPKSAIAGFERVLVSQLAAHRVRIKAVAHGPLWNPLVPSDPDTELPVNQHHGNPGPCFVFLARNEKPRHASVDCR